MATWTPDPTFYPSPKMAMGAPQEELAYVVIVNPKNDGRPDALGVMDVDPKSSDYGKVVGKMDLPSTGDELAPFWLERVQRVPVPEHAAPPRRAPLSAA